MQPRISTAVLLIAHGSRQSSANDDLRGLAKRISAMGAYSVVGSCFLEFSERSIASEAERCIRSGVKRVLMIPYFLSEGMHFRRDLRAAKEELARRHPTIEFRLGQPLGPDPLLDQLVHLRIMEVEIGVDSERPTG